VRGLRAQQLDQRFSTAEGVLTRLGQVDLARQRGNARSIVLTVTHPGWGASTSASLRFVETWLHDNDRWGLARYAYDLLLVPGPGRLGFHWHDSVHHTHCVDPRHPDRDHHFRGAPIDLFTAAERFGAILNGTELLTCGNLRRVR
jgi:hypothetical protein